MKPCEETCPKCGSEDVHHRFRAEGEMWSQDKYGKTSKYASGMAYTMTASKDHIEHFCRGCNYDWQGLPLKKALASTRAKTR